MYEISQLKGKRFVIEPYQRGYKWTKTEVEQLLNDIDGFKLCGDRFYCLQPVIVRKLKDDSYELIDGQQRLTTICMILAYLGASDSEFIIEYRTREESTEYLERITPEGNGGCESHKTIDQYYLSAALSAIREWFGGKTDQDKELFKEKLLNRTKVIWQEVAADSATSAERIFLNFNSGKIPLTDAERIKALFLKGSASAENIDLRILQTEISQEWDRFESELRNPEFWYFLSGKNAEQNDNPRIDLLFRLVTRSAKPTSPFAYYEEQGETLLDVEGCRGEWEKVKSCFLRLHDWFTDPSIYHPIGFLIASGTNVEDLWSQYNAKSMASTDWRKALCEECKGKIEGWKLATYGDDNQKMTRALLLFNILSLPEEERFPFHRYHREEWSLEHINPQNPEADEGNDSVADGSLHEMQNMALLACADNSSLSNKSFSEKRKAVIGFDKKGRWLPVCTRNVFLRYYSENIETPEKWTARDREVYLEAMTEKLNNITF